MADQDDGATSIRSKGSSGDSGADREASEGSRVVKKIDRLSLLPNELLHHIFDLAHTIYSRSKGALSKHLLPFHITGIYRRIRLYKGSTFVALIDCVRRNPNLGAMIEIIDAHMYAGSEHPDPVEGLGWFYSHLPRITEISITGRLAAPFAFRTLATSALNPPLPLLRTITTPFFPIYPSPFRSFTRLTSLRHLRITEFDLSDKPQISHFDTGDLPSLVTLAIEGYSADDTVIGDLCQTCPRLINLALSTNRPDYRPMFPSLSEHLTHLSLWNTARWSGQAFVDHFLPKFPYLVQLALGDALFSRNITQHLASLVSLESLKLGKGLFNAQEMISLITDFDGLGELEYLHLDTLDGVPGDQIVPPFGWAGKTWYRPEDDYWEDWLLPEFTEEGGLLSLEDAKELVDTAEEYGVKVDGDVIGAIVTMELFLYEVANLAILRSYLDADLSHIETLQENSEDNLRLPPFDLDSLDHADLRLIKLGPRGDEWVKFNFNLSLKGPPNSESEVKQDQKDELVECELVYDEENERLEVLWKL